MSKFLLSVAMCLVALTSAAAASAAAVTKIRSVS